MHKLDIRKREIINILKKRKFAITMDLAYALNVTSRTIRSDLEYLRTLNYPIVIKKGNQGGIYWYE